MPLQPREAQAHILCTFNSNIYQTISLVSRVTFIILMSLHCHCFNKMLFSIETICSLILPDQIFPHYFMNLLMKPKSLTENFYSLEKCKWRQQIKGQYETQTKSLAKTQCGKINNSLALISILESVEDSRQKVKCKYKNIQTTGEKKQWTFLISYIS